MIDNQTGEATPETLEVLQKLLLGKLTRPPQELVAMRRVVNNQKLTAGEIWYSEWRRDKPREFVIEMRRLEKEWRDQQLDMAKIAAMESGSRGANLPSDEGAQRAIELCEQWLKERQNGDKDEQR